MYDNFENAFLCKPDWWFTEYLVIKSSHGPSVFCDFVWAILLGKNVNSVSCALLCLQKCGHDNLRKLHTILILECIYRR